MIVSSRTIPEAFFETAGRFSEKTALLYKKEGSYFPISYQKLSGQVKIFSAVLQNLGVKKGDRVTLFSENRPEWVVSDLAIMSNGAITTPIHTTFSSKAILAVLNHSQSEIIIVSNNELLEKVLLGAKELQFLKKIIFLEKSSSFSGEAFGKEILNWQELLNSADENNFKAPVLNPEDVCSIIYTSGTTGIPKGVELCHRNFLSNVEAVNQAVPIKTDDIFLSFLPLSHVLERLAGYYTPFLIGATVAYVESPKHLLANLKEIKPTILISVPRIFEKFYDAVWDKIRRSSVFKKKIFFWALKQKKNSFSHKIADLLVFKKIRNQMGGRLRLTVSGGASLDQKIARFFLKIGILILEGYGLTETSPVVSVNRENDFKFSTVGKPISGVNVKISAEKEILIKGPNIMNGYFKNPEETNLAIDKDNWFYSGDLGFLDSEGFLTIIGRKKEMLVTSGGKNVWPEPIERQLNNDLFVSQSMIIGNNRKFISALIVPNQKEVELFLKSKKSEDILNLFQGVVDKVNKDLSDFEKIRKFKLIADEFSQERDEMTPTLKLRRRFIEERYQKEISGMYQSFGEFG